MPHDYYITPDEYDTAERNGINRNLLQNRVYHQLWKKERAITTPPRKYNKGCKYLSQAQKNGIKRGTYYRRLERGWSKEKAATTPIKNVNNKQHLDKIRAKGLKKIRKYPEWVYKELRKNNISRDVFWQRVNTLNWDIKDACTIPPRKRKVDNEKHVWRRYSALGSGTQRNDAGRR